MSLVLSVCRWCAFAQHRRLDCAWPQCNRAQRAFPRSLSCSLSWLSSIETQHAGRQGKQAVCTASLQHACMCSAGDSPPALPVCAVHEHQGPLLEARPQGRGASLQPEQHPVSPRPGPAPSMLCTRLAQPWNCWLPEHCCAWHPNIWLGCRAASESSIAMAYRLADTLAAHGPAAPVDIDAAMQAISLTCISQGGPCVMLCLPC